MFFDLLKILSVVTRVVAMVGWPTSTVVGNVVTAAVVTIVTLVDSNNGGGGGGSDLFLGEFFFLFVGGSIVTITFTSTVAAISL